MNKNQYESASATRSQTRKQAYSFSLLPKEYDRLNEIALADSVRADAFISMSAVIRRLVNQEYTRVFGATPEHVIRNAREAQIATIHDQHVNVSEIGRIQRERIKEYEPALSATGLVDDSDEQPPVPTFEDSEA